MTFKHRKIDVTITLGEGSFGESGTDTVKLSGHRVSAVICKDGTPAMNTAQVRINGMTPSLMNRISRIGMIPTATRNNIVTIEAGSDEDGMSVCFAGIIMDAFQDFTSPPNVAFCITAATGALAAVKPAQASSFPGPTDVAEIIKGLAAQMGYTFENNGVSVMLSSPYFWGSPRQQVISAAVAAHVVAVFDDEQGRLAILPRDGVRGTPVPLISGETGMVGYPTYAGPGQIRVRCLYNPVISFMGQIDLKTDIDSSSNVKTASGLWRVIKLTHTLEALQPGGAWFTDLIGNLQLASRSAKP